MADEDISEAEVWTELDKMYLYTERLPGDVDTQQIMERYGVCDTNARRRMKALERTGKWKLIWIRDDTSSIGKRRVLRKVR